MLDRKHIPVIAVSGGPCGAKSTFISFIQQKLTDYGWHVVVVSEAATDFIMAGLRPWEIHKDHFQLHLLKYIIEKEEAYKAAAQLIPSEKVVVICDRGRADARAYMANFDFDRMLGGLGMNLVDLCDRPYDAVLFMQSVAVDRPELFTCANNEARTESASDARHINKLTLEAWNGHPHLMIIGNEGSLDTKLNRALQAVCHTLGIPAPLEIERKFFYTGKGMPKFPVPNVVQAMIEQYYLVSQEAGVEERIRARGRDGGKLHYHTFKQRVSDEVRIERERQISEGEYFALLDRADPERGKIEKWRHCFVWQNQYFEMDIIQRIGAVYLEVETTEEGQEVVLPPEFEGQFTDVTGQPEHSNYEIARRLRGR